MNDDTISRKQAIDALMSLTIYKSKREIVQAAEKDENSWIGGVAECIDEIEDLPPAEPKRGKWIDGIIPNDSGGLPVIVCDQCNTFFPLQFGDGHNFCPNCGADMRGEQDG